MNRIKRLYKIWKARMYLKYTIWGMEGARLERRKLQEEMKQVDREIMKRDMDARTAKRNLAELIEPPRVRSAFTGSRQHAIREEVAPK